MRRSTSHNDWQSTLKVSSCTITSSNPYFGAPPAFFRTSQTATQVWHCSLKLSLTKHGHRYVQHRIQLSSLRIIRIHAKTQAPLAAYPCNATIIARRTKHLRTILQDEKRALTRYHYHGLVLKADQSRFHCWSHYLGVSVDFLQSMGNCIRHSILLPHKTGTRFVSKFFETLCSHLETQHLTTTALPPEEKRPSQVIHQIHRDTFIH